MALKGLGQLNYFVIWEHFEMESIHLVEDLIQEGDWVIKMDLKNAYFSIPFIWQWLLFQWKEQIYKFHCLAFGLSLAPWVFTKVTRPIVAWLRQLGVRMVAYINNFRQIPERKPTLPTDSDNVQSPGVPNQHRDIPLYSMTRTRASGCHSPVTTPNTSAATNKDESNQRQSHLASEEGCLTPD